MKVEVAILRRRGGREAQKEEEMSERGEAYAAIDGEREYQKQQWGDATCSSGEQGNSPTEWLVFIEHYLNKAKAIAATSSYVEANPQIMDIMRKVAAMAVAAMEQHGAIPRHARND